MSACVQYIVSNYVELPAHGFMYNTINIIVMFLLCCIFVLSCRVQ